MSFRLDDTPPELEKALRETENPPESTPSSDRASSAKKTRPSPATSTERTPSRGSLERRVLKRLQATATLVESFDEDDHPCGEIIRQGAPQLAKSLDDLALENPRVKKFLEASAELGAFGEVLVAAGAIVVPILAAHDRLPKLRRRSRGRNAPSPDVSPPSSDDEEIARAIGGFAQDGPPSSAPSDLPPVV